MVLKCVDKDFGMWIKRAPVRIHRRGKEQFPISPSVSSGNVASNPLSGSADSNLLSAMPAASHSYSSHPLLPLIFFVVTSVIVVSALSAFLLALLTFVLDFSSSFFISHHLIVLFLPIAGAFAYFVYKFLRVPYGISDDDVMSAAAAVPISNDQNCEISSDAVEPSLSSKHYGSLPCAPIRIVVAIFAGTVLTVLFGGSVGSESAAFQISACLAIGFISFVSSSHFYDKQRHSVPVHLRHFSSVISSLPALFPSFLSLLMKCGISSALAAILGTPIACALFAWEMFPARKNKKNQKKNNPCHIIRIIEPVMLVLSGLIGWIVGRIARGEEIIWQPHLFSLSFLDSLLSILPSILLTFAACLFFSLIWYAAMVKGRSSIRALISTHRIPILFAIAASGIVYVFVFLILLSSISTIESGTGSTMIQFLATGNPLSLEDAQTVFSASISKIVLTFILLTGMFKGGDLTPTLAIGAGIGASVGVFLGLPVGFGAMIGLSSFLSVCTNCKLSASVYCIEMFGASGISGVFFALVSYVLTRNLSFYRNKKEPVHRVVMRYFSPPSSQA